MSQIKNLATTTTLAILFLAGLWTGHATLRLATTPPDTLHIHHVETLVIERPVERLRTIVRHDTVWLPSINNKVSTADSPPSRDSARTIIPIHRVRYTDDSTFVAVISGHRARLDSLVWLRRESHTTLRTPHTTPPRIVITAGPQTGIYRTPTGWQPGIGFGIGVGITLTPRRNNK